MKQDKGFITVACNDYLPYAYRLAKSIKANNKIANVSVIVDAAVDPVYSDVFDKILLVDKHPNKFWAETQVCKLSPYKQTIKIEADMIVPQSIDNWWDILDQKNVVLTNHVKTYWGDTVTNRSQRKLFDDNNLPDIYSGIYYFRYSKESYHFFNLVNEIFENWNWFKNNLKNCRYEEPVTDEVFAIAAEIFGIENCTINNSIPSFVHMKNTLQDIPSDDNWYNYVMYEPAQQAIGMYKQYYPIHYCDKTIWNSHD
jgi:hypothetical protein